MSLARPSPGGLRYGGAIGATAPVVVRLIDGADFRRPSGLLVFRLAGVRVVDKMGVVRANLGP